MIVQSVDFRFNPFALETSRSALSDKQQSLMTKIWKGASGAFYDIYVKNPYDLTVGNCRKLLNAPEPQSRRTKIAVGVTAAFATLYTLMLYGTSIHLQGRLLQGLGNEAGIAVLSRVGECAQVLGKNLFVTGAVPIYGLFYALPKQIILSLPKVAQFVAAQVKSVATWVFQYVLTPLWTKVIVPVAQAAFKGLQFVVTKMSVALKELCCMVASVAKFVLQNVILPTLKMASRVLTFVAKALVETLQVLAQETVKVASYIFQKIIVPVFKGLAYLVVEAGKFLGQYVVKPVGSVLCNLTYQVGAVAKAIFDLVIVPVVNIVAGTFTALGNTLSEFKTEIAQTITTMWNATQRVFG